MAATSKPKAISKPQPDEASKPKATSSAEYNATTILLQQYEQVCKSYHAIDDFRAKLLAILPIASGLGAITLLVNNPASKSYLLPIGILGACITAGLFVFEARGAQRCQGVKQVAKELEQRLGLDPSTGQFWGMPEPIFGVVREFAAGVVVYSTVLVGWLLLAFHGAELL